MDDLVGLPPDPSPAESSIVRQELAAPLRSRRTRATTTLLIFLVGVAAVCVIAWRHQLAVRARADAEFTALADEVARRLVDRIVLYEYGLRGARGAIIAAVDHSHSIFRVYRESRDIDRQFPGARGFGFIRRVARADEAAFVAVVQADDAPDFTIHELAPHAGERFVIQTIEPIEANREALGLDIASEGDRRRAAELALRSGELAITAPITLIQAPGHEERGFLLLLPIYRPGAPIGSDEERAAAGFGWAYCAILIDEVLASFKDDRARVSLALADVSDGGPLAFFYGEPTPAADAVVRRIDRSLFGRRWAIEVRGAPGFEVEAEPIAVGTVVIVGVVGAALLAALLHALMLGQIRRIEARVERAREREAAARQLRRFNATLAREVAQRTAELETMTRDRQTILDALPSMVGYWDKDLINRFANRSYYTWFGVDAESIVGRSIRDLLGPEIFERNRPHIEAALRGEAQVFERSIPGPCGLRHSLAHYLPDVVDGEVRGFYALVHDISDVYEGREKVAASEAFLARAGEVAKVGGWQIDVATRELTWTEETRRILEVEAEVRPQIDRGLALFEPGARAVLMAALERAFTAGEGIDLELPVATAKGRAIWVHLVAEVEGVAAGARLIGAIQDVTAMHAAGEALREAKRVAEEASAAKSVFVANMSHEIRTPLNAIIGLAYLLERTAQSPEQRDLIINLATAGRALLGLVNDVLDLSRIESGVAMIDVAPLCLKDLVDEVLTVFRPQAASKGLWLAAHGVARLPAVVEGDAGRIRQILINLVGNAIKFTERGGVDLRLEVFDADADDARLMLRVTVTDTGIGISAEAKARIFMPFVQGDPSTTRRFGGTGLGLSIVRRLVAMMDGEAGVRSVVGEGSEFWVTLALARALPGLAAPTSPAASAIVGGQLAGLRFLIVDDSDINREIAGQILTLEGADVVACSNGAEAVEQLRAVMNGAAAAIDFVLMDVQMPVMDGNEATRRIRGELGLGALPVIALTAGARAAAREQVLAAGMNDFLVKPLNPRLLLDVILRHAQGLGPERL